MGVDVRGDRDALHLRPVLGIVQDLLGRHNAGLDDVLVMIDVMNEHVERLDPLRQTSFELRPFGCGNDAGDDVEGDQALGAGIVAIHGKGDADAAEDQVGFGPFAGNRLRRLFGEPGGEVAVVLAYRIRSIGVHLVIKSCHGKF